MKKFLSLFIFAIVFIAIGFVSRELYEHITGDTTLTSPFVSKQEEPKQPLLTYSFANLKNREYIPSKINIESLIEEKETYSSYVFSYTTLGKKMTGQLNIPTTVEVDDAGKPKVIVLVRGYVPLSIYETGEGTRNAASVFAQSGYVTLAPDFFGYGESDPEPTDTWQARFEKPIAVIELLKTIETTGVPTQATDLRSQAKVTNQAETTSNTEANTESETDTDTSTYSLQPTANIGLWAHSNGGQITLAVLEILSKPIPTTLWAPVVVPFPYSILYFSDEEADEGKAARKYVSLFEEEYDVFEFSLTKHLDWLTGPLILHHGTVDEAAPIAWSDEFVDKIEIENDRRTEILNEMETETATESGRNNLVDKTLLQSIDLTFHRYPGTNHNMQPEWNIVIQRDLGFFKKELN